jgi:DNA-directed RNA polymerase subunit RPC12/RpoP
VGVGLLQAAPSRLRIDAMRIDLRDRERRRLFRVELEEGERPACVRRVLSAVSSGDQAVEAIEVALEWDQAFDGAGHLVRCPACGCRELFVRKDFPQALGLGVVVAGAVGATALFAMERPGWMLAVLVGVPAVDAVLSVFAGRLLVCHRCRSEFRGVLIDPRAVGFELATAEKYRPAG